MTTIDIQREERYGDKSLSSASCSHPLARAMIGMVWVLCCLLTTEAVASTLSAVDDSFGVPHAATLQVEPFGVLDNDTIDGSAAGNLGGVAELVQAPLYGSLSCPTDGSRALCADGSFRYTPDANFPGRDSFSYRFQYGGVYSNSATVALDACSGGPEIFSCWSESAYLAKLAALGYVTFSEGFEGSAWDVAREPTTAVSVTSGGIAWQSNHPTTNNITTGSGAAHSGQYGLYDPDHGSATGSVATCDINNPPAYCLYHDGFSGMRVSGMGALHGIGGYFSGTVGANMAIILDGVQQYGLGKLQGGGGDFFGVIDTSLNGFGTFEFLELDGKVGQMRIVFGDDFAFAIAPAVGNTAPLADAGIGQTVAVGGTVTLDGSASSDVDGDPLSYSWSFASKPAGSSASFSNPTAVRPTFVIDIAGDYVAQLIVNDGQLNSAPASVTVSTHNTAPVANAGLGLTVAVGSSVTLDGGASSDADGDPLSYTWSFTAKPAGSNAIFSNPTAVQPTFVVDMDGDYVAQLIVNDGQLNSAPASVTISTRNTAPIADAGLGQTVTVGSSVTLDGGASSDADGDPLSYTWSFTAKPAGSSASFSNPTAVRPTFIADMAGDYVMQLIVNDGMRNSIPSTVTISSSPFPGTQGSGGGGGAVLWLIWLLCGGFIWRRMQRCGT